MYTVYFTGSSSWKAVLLDSGLLFSLGKKEWKTIVKESKKQQPAGVRGWRRSDSLALQGSPAGIRPHQQPVSQEGLVGDIKCDDEGALRGERKEDMEKVVGKEGEGVCGDKEASAEDLGGQVALTLAPSRKMG